MAKKYLIYFLIIFALVASGTAIAKTDKGEEVDLPETEGIYDVPGHPNLKLRVIVHKGKPDIKPVRPTSTTTLSLVCNIPDLTSSAVVAPAGWVMPANWTYRLNPSSVPAIIGGNKLATIASNAFSPWNSAISGAVNITRGADTTVSRAARDNQNIISWGRTSGTALATTYIWYNTSTTPYQTVELDTIMNNKFKWAWSDPSTWVTLPDTTCAYQGVYDAQDIMTHEIGHWYGLDDVYTSDYTNNTMFGSGSTGRTNADTLTTGDIAGVQAIY